MFVLSFSEKKQYTIRQSEISINNFNQMKIFERHSQYNYTSLHEMQQYH